MTMPPPLSGIRACVFDAYGTLFDVNSAASQAKDALGDKWRPLAELWRAKQLQYTGLRGLSRSRSEASSSLRLARAKSSASPVT